MTGILRGAACLGAVLLAAGTAGAQEPAPTDTAFRAELLRMRAEDQDGRERVAQAAAFDHGFPRARGAPAGGGPSDDG